MLKFTVTINGEKHEVDRSAITAPDGIQILGPDDVPDGYVKQEVMDSTIQDRVKNAKKNALKEASSDESVRNQVLSELGIEIDDDGNPVVPKADVDIEKEREKWKKQNLDPVQTELEEARGSLTNLQTSTVRQAIRGAFAGKAKDEYLDNEIGSPYVEQVFASKFKYNPEIKKVLQVDDDGNFEMHPNGKSANGHGYIEPDDYITLNASSKMMKRILKDETQGGSGFKGGGGGDLKKITRKQFDEKTPAEQQKIATSGVEIVD